MKVARRPTRDPVKSGGTGIVFPALGRPFCGGDAGFRSASDAARNACLERDSPRRDLTSVRRFDGQIGAAEAPERGLSGSDGARAELRERGRAGKKKGD